MATHLIWQRAQLANANGVLYLVLYTCAYVFGTKSYHVVCAFVFPRAAAEAGAAFTSHPSDTCWETYMRMSAEAPDTIGAFGAWDSFATSDCFVSSD